MKQVSETLQNLLMEYMQGKRNTWYIADLYVFWLNKGTGAVLRYTGHDCDLTIGSNTYTHWPIQHDDIKELRGTETSETKLTIYYNPTDTITTLGVTWAEAFRSGVFDNCYLSIHRLYSPDAWSLQTTNYSIDYVLPNRFMGRIDVDSANMTKCELTCKSLTELLNIEFPRNLIIPSCLNAFCDSSCGLTKSSYATSVTAQTGSTKNSIITGLSLIDGYFNYGSMTCTSGKNKGVTRTIKSYKSNIATPVYPFNMTVSEGDTFTFYRGCAKTKDACTAYGNISRFKGFPYLPVQNTLL